MHPAPNDTLVEIGPGRAALTEPLSRVNAAALHLIELDRDLARSLSSRFEDARHITVHQGDALRFDIATLGHDLRIVGNLPYNISTPLLFHLLNHRQRIADMHFMLQKEVVDRITAEPGSKRYGRLTIMLGCALDAEHLFDVPPDAFNPPPKVNSSVVRLVPKRTAGIGLRFDRLNRLVTQAFAKRRKTLHNALKGVVSDDEMRSAGIDPRDRPEQIDIGRWLTLADVGSNNETQSGEPTADLM